MDITNAVDLGARAAYADSFDLSRLVEEREAIAILIGIAARERLAPAIAELRRLGSADIVEAGIRILWRAFDPGAGLAAFPAAHIHAALADGAEILVEAFLIVMAAEGAIDLATISKDEVAIITFLAGIEDTIAAGG